MTQADLTLPRPHPAVAEWLTVERAGYALAAMAAFGLRAYGLAQPRLGPSEAVQALPAWQSAMGRPYELVAGMSPLLFNLQRLLMIPFGGSDALPRWPAVLFGALAPLLFYALRDRLGRGGALAAAFLWAFSPLAVFFGRLGMEYGLVAPLALALVAALNLYYRSGASRWLIWAAISLGLLLAAGQGAWAVVLTGVVVALIWRSPWRTLWAAIVANARQVALAGVLAFLAGATGFFITMQGLPLAVDLLGRAVRSLLPGAAPVVGDVFYTSWELVLRLLVSEPLLVVLGVGGVARALRRHDRFALAIALGGGIALLLALAGAARHPGDLGLVVLALAVLAGPVVADILRVAAGWLRELDPWLLLALSLALLAAAAISLPASVTAALEDYRRLYTAVGLITLGLCVVLWIVFALWGNWDIVRRTLPVLVLVVLGLWGIGQLSSINFNHDTLRYAAVLGQVPGPDWVDLRTELRNQTPLYTTGRFEAPIDVVSRPGPRGQPDPLVSMLLWELKDDPNLRQVTALGTPPAPFIITIIPAGTKPGPQAGIPAAYNGANFDLLEKWQPQQLSGYPDWLQWLLYRTVNQPAEKQEAVLWVNRATSNPAAGSAPGFVPVPAPGSSQ